jgi:hypothetical protein
MKKELLVASALVSTLGLAGIAEAGSATMSGHQRVGVVGKDLDSSTSDSTDASRQSAFSVSISETTDSGIKVSTGFDLAEESSTLDMQGITLTFTDGSKLDLIEAGAANASHAVSVPGAAGEQGISASTTSSAPTSITMGSASDNVGFEYHTAADAFGIEGFKASVSASFNGDVDAVSDASTATLENSYAIGVTYVDTAGDSTVTIGAGLNSADYNSTVATKDTSVYQIGITAVTGDLTVGAGYASGDIIRGGDTGGSGRAATQNDAEYTKVGVKYVSGDITFNVGMGDGESTDEALGTSNAGLSDTRTTTGASVGYSIASGVSATLGYTTVDSDDEGLNDTAHSGTSWYVGALVSF